MGIVLKWNFRSLLSNVPRLILTVLSIAGTFAVLVAMGLSVESHMAAIGSLNEGLPKFVLTLVRPAILAAFAMTMYVLFTVSLAERKNQYFIMRSFGMTTRQLLWGIFAEAAALDAAGAVLGVGTGFLIAWRRLLSSGIALSPEVFFNRSALLYGILPALLLPPAMMLAASPGLLWQKRDRGRKKPSKKDRAPFRKRLLPRLFGTGGTLEYTLGKQQGRYRILQVTAIVVNVAVLFLMMAGLSILADMEAAVQCDMQVSFGGAPENTDTPRTDGDGLRVEMNALLEDCRSEGLLQSFVHVRTYSLYACVIENAALSDKALAAYGSDGSGFTDLLRLNDRQHVINNIELYCFDDAFFDRFAEEERGLTYSGSGAVLYNRCAVKSNRLPIVDGLPTAGVTLYPMRGAYEDLFWRSGAGDMLTMPETADALLNSDEAVALPVGGLLNAWWGDSTLMRYDLALLEGSVILPERMLSQYAAALHTADMAYEDSYYIMAADTESLYRRMEGSLGGKSSLTVRRQTLGDGNAFRYPSAGARTEQASPGNINVNVYDYRRDLSDYRVFLAQMDWLYRFLAVVIFVMIGLNIVDIVHMNRLSRRREYAILTTVGLGARQKTGMLLYESFRLTVRIVAVGMAAMVVVAKLVYPYYYSIGGYEKLLPAGIRTLSGSSYSIWDELRVVAENLWQYISPHWSLIVFVLLFLFGGLLLTEWLTLKRMEKDELVTILKDDINE